MKVLNKLLLLILGATLITAPFSINEIYAQGFSDDSPSSNNYVLRSYGFGAGGGHDISSNNYDLMGILGELSHSSLSSNNYRTLPGLQYMILSNTPPAPDFINDDDDYNMLKFTLNHGNNPSDALFAIAISDDDFTTTRYVKSDNTIGDTLIEADWQTYTDWGGASGNFVVGLDSNTTYQIKVKAEQGSYTESPWGPTASATTSSLTLSFDIDVSQIDENTSPPFVLEIGELVTNSVITSLERVWVDLETNAKNGGAVYVYGNQTGLYSSSTDYTISTVTGNLISLSEGFGLQVASTAQTAGGPLVAISPYNNGDEVVGDLSTSPQSIFDSSQSPIYDGRGSFVFKAKASPTTPAASDYNNIITVIAAASF
jgi:hypothetical protein